MDVIKITPTSHFCEKCSITCKKKSDWERHILTSKHLFSKINENYECNKCNYLTSSLQDWNKHIKTKKHLIDKSSKIHECDVCNTQFSRKLSFIEFCIIIFWTFIKCPKRF